MENNNLIVIKQLPIIEEKLKQLSTEIDEKVESAKALICTEESVKEVKTVRADLNKDFKELEAKRKDVKEKIMQPYMQFESIYKECVSDKFKSADIELKNKIDTVENELKLNDILIFKGEDKIVVHRLVRIEKKNGKYYYRTKGDNNTTEDVLDVTYDSIKGKVVFRIPYIAYPSVYISELLNGGD